MSSDFELTMFVLIEKYTCFFCDLLRDWQRDCKLFFPLLGSLSGRWRVFEKVVGDRILYSYFKSSNIEHFSFQEN